MKTNLINNVLVLIAYNLLIALNLIASSKNEKPSNPIFSPFEIHIDPMEKLLLINIEKDPDTLYLGFEPQVFNDPVNGEGILVIGWRTDGYVDVYHQSSLNPDSSKYNIAGKGLKYLVETVMPASEYRVEENGVKLNVSFKDIWGREIELYVNEQNSSTRKPFSLLAPMGHGAEKPEALPLLFLHDFYFIRRKDTEFKVSVNGKLHQPDKFPMRMDGTKIYYARYSPDPLIATLNPAQRDYLEPFTVTECGNLYHDQTRASMETINGKTFIKSLQRQYKDIELTMEFYPAFPNLTEMADGKNYQGSFEVEGRMDAGKVSGSWSALKTGNSIHIALTPDGGWKPRPDRFTLRMIYTMGSIFKKWPKSYSWEANITVDEYGRHFMQSAWTKN